MRLRCKRCNTPDQPLLRVRNEKVRGSNPLSSTHHRRRLVRRDASPADDPSAGDPAHVLWYTCPMARRRYGRSPAVTVLGVLVLLWLLIGAFAAGQRGYFGGSSASCARVGTTIVTIIAGPLNYVGANPKIDCEVPQPSR